jgi:hypothetical protein
LSHRRGWCIRARSIDYSDTFERYERGLTNFEVTFDDLRLARSPLTATGIRRPSPGAL